MPIHFFFCMSCALAIVLKYYLFIIQDFSEDSQSGGLQTVYSGLALEIYILKHAINMRKSQYCCDSSDSVRSICNSLLIKVNRQGSNTSEDSVAGQARRRREPGKRSGAGSRRHEIQKTGRRSVGRQQTIKE